MKKIVKISERWSPVPRPRCPSAAGGFASDP